jgi:hypothetical protein
VLLIALQYAAQVVAQTPAFPGAEGPGATATGGRGGDVYHVTNLEFDQNGVIPGSLKYGINTAPSAGRTIVFDVGGTIYQNGGGANWWFRSSKSNITVAGQTAPGPGITIAGVGSKWTGNNVILRNITVRPNKDPTNPTNFTYDAFGSQLTNSIIDHVSASWFTDEGISQTDSGHTTTIQYATIGEGLNYNGHAYGSIISTEVDGAQIAVHHNLYAHLKSRIPRVGSELALTQTGAVANFANNVIYNWQPNSAGYSGTNQPSSTNFLNNYYIKGANNGQTPFDGGDDNGATGVTKVYENGGNKIDLNKNGAVDGTFFNRFTSNPKAFAGGMTFFPAAFNVSGVGTLDTADGALDRVLEFGGAQWWNRNPIEQRIVAGVRTGAGAMVYDLTTGVQAGEWATVLAQRPAAGAAPYVREANWDADGDGMPNAWEQKHGLDPNAAGNHGDFDSDGYSNLEEYINEIAAWPAPAPIVFQGGAARFAQIQNWRVSGETVNVAGQGNVASSSLWQPSRFDTAVIENGVATVDAVGQHAGNLILAPNPGDNATLNVTAGWIDVEDAPHGLSDGITVIGDDPAATATLNLSGGKLATKTLLKGPGGAFNFTGGVLSAETIGFALVNDGGTISPGAGPGQTHVMGGLTIDSGALQIELGGPGAGEFDQLVIEGMATLGGTLEVALVDNFSLTSNSTFKILDIAGARTGEFAGLGEGALVGNFGEDLFISYTAGDGNDVALYTMPAMDGDVDQDNDVDGADLLAWQRNPVAGNLADWQANFGRTSAVALGAATPEPGSLTLALLLFSAAAASRVRG